MGAYVWYAVQAYIIFISLWKMFDPNMTIYFVRAHVAPIRTLASKNNNSHAQIFYAAHILYV